MATPDWTIGPATPSDVPGIMLLIEECFSPTWRSTVLYGDPRASSYAAELIRRQNTGGDAAFIVARSADAQVLGFVEIRRLPNSVHLNNMATSAAARGRGIYAALMAEAVSLGRAEGYAQASLDVFVDNPIRTFLLSVGYRVMSAVTWRAATLPVGPKPGGVYFGGLPQANAAHARFGFSQVKVLTTRGAAYEIGRLGRLWFRVTEPAILTERDVLLALYNLDAGRELLAIVPVGTSVLEGLTLRELGISERLRGDVGTVLPLLRRRSERRPQPLASPHR